MITIRRKNKPVPRSLIWIHGSDVMDGLKIGNGSKMKQKTNLSEFTLIVMMHKYDDNSSLWFSLYSEMILVE
jgi:hypothetical protein